MDVAALEGASVEMLKRERGGTPRAYALPASTSSRSSTGRTPYASRRLSSLPPPLLEAHLFIAEFTEPSPSQPSSSPSLAATSHVESPESVVPDAFERIPQEDQEGWEGSTSDEAWERIGYEIRRERCSRRGVAGGDSNDRDAARLRDLSDSSEREAARQRDLFLRAKNVDEGRENENENENENEKGEARTREDGIFGERSWG